MFSTFSVRNGPDEYFLCWRLADCRNLGEPAGLTFYDQTSALNFLRSVIADSGRMHDLRVWLSDQNYSVAMYLASDDELMDQVAFMLASGQLSAATMERLAGGRELTREGFVRIEGGVVTPPEGAEATVEEGSPLAEELENTSEPRIVEEEEIVLDQGTDEDAVEEEELDLTAVVYADPGPEAALTAAVEDHPPLPAEEELEQSPVVTPEEQHETLPALPVEAALETAPPLEMGTAVDAAPKIAPETAFDERPEFETEAAVQKPPTLGTEATAEEPPLTETEAALDTRRAVDTDIVAAPTPAPETETTIRSQPDVETEFTIAGGSTAAPDTERRHTERGKEAESGVKTSVEKLPRPSATEAVEAPAEVETRTTLAKFPAAPATETTADERPPVETETAMKAPPSAPETEAAVDEPPAIRTETAVKSPPSAPEIEATTDAPRDTDSDVSIRKPGKVDSDVDVDPPGGDHQD